MAAAVGDVDGDGNPDLALGLPSQQAVEIVDALRAASSSCAWTARPGSVAYGGVLAASGDLDGDGVPDFCVADEESSPRAIQAVSAASGQVLFQKTFSSQPIYIYLTMDASGDCNGDGVHDLVVGSMADNAAWLFDGSSGALLHTYLAIGSYGTFGFSVSNSGDYDGDGLEDVTVGNESNLSVMRSSDFALIKEFLPWGSWYTAAAGCPDFDGDGLDDLLVGADEFWVYGNGHIRS